MEAERVVTERQQPEGLTTGTARGRKAGLLGMALLTAVILSGCSLQEWQRGAMPEPATEEGLVVLSFWQGTWVAALIVGALVWGLMIWCIIAFRRRRRPAVPEQLRYHMPIEVLWTVAPLMAVIGIFYFAQRDETELLSLSDEPTNTVEVIGFRWSWAFNYIDEQVYDTGEAAYLPGEDARGPVPKVGEFNIPDLYLPVNETVRFNLVSPDVIHSFWVPDFLFKLDVVPGRENSFEVTPTKLGTYAGRCAELCGVDHSRMLFNVYVVTQEEFDAHMEELRRNGQSGLLETGRISTNAQSVQ